MGDFAGSPYFTHIGVDDFRVVLDNLSGGNRVTTGRQVPFCLFTDPELAPGRAERTGGPRARRRVPPGQDPFGRRAADTDTFRDAGIPEGAIEKGATASSASPHLGSRPAKSWPSPKSRWRPAYRTRRCGTPS